MEPKNHNDTDAYRDVVPVAHDELEADKGEDIADAVLEQGEELTSSPSMKYAACRPRMAKTVEV